MKNLQATEVIFHINQNRLCSIGQEIEGVYQAQVAKLSGLAWIGFKWLSWRLFWVGVGMRLDQVKIKKTQPSSLGIWCILYVYCLFMLLDVKQRSKEMRPHNSILQWDIVCRLKTSQKYTCTL